MAILVGVNPGGRSNFAVCALFWPGRFPALLVHNRSYSAVDEVLDDIVGVTGEWGELQAVAIDAPLSWSGSKAGWRPADRFLRSSAAEWVPSAWFKPPNALPGSVSVQGPALTWALAREVRDGQIPKHRVLETHARYGLSRVAPDLRQALLGYRNTKLRGPTRMRHIARVTERLVDTGMVKLETRAPEKPDELDALVCALTALGAAVPESGVVIKIIAPGELQPVGKRPIAVLQALP